MDDPITISSSDSDLDFEFGSDDDDAFSTNVRAEGYGEYSGNAFSAQSATGSMPRPLNPSYSVQMRDPQRSFNVASSGFPRNFSSSEHQKRSMDPLDKLAFSSSSHFPASNTKPNNFRGSEHPHQANGSGYSYPFPVAPSFMNGKNHEKYKFDNDGVNGVLPPWPRAFPTSSGRYASSFDPIDPFRNGDERIGGTDERSVFQEVIQDLNQPKQEAELPYGLLTVPLLRHQKIALAWMRHKEARPFCVGGILADDQGLGKTISTIALIQMERHSEQKSQSQDHKKCITECLDDDENGIVSLDVVKPEDSNGIVDLDDIKPEVPNGIVSLDDIKPEVSNGIRPISKGSSSQQSSSTQRPAAGTLVVCPATVLRQWARELNDKVTEAAKLKVLVYHGSNRTKDPSELATYDVVLTTYALVANEVPKQPLVDEDDPGEKYGDGYPHGVKRKKPSSSSKKGKKGLDSSSFDSEAGTLAKVRWLRVVLDEAQTIKNHRTQAARACCGLRAKKRWCLSGTPIQNAIEELFSYFRFLKYDPYSSYKAFCEGIKGPIQRDSKSGYQKLQVVLRTVMLRRTKGTLIDGQPIISLPPKYIKMKSIDFTFDEREFYSKLEKESRIQFKAYSEAGTVNQNYANILLMLLRLRQACDHPVLVCGVDSNSTKSTFSIQTLKRLPKDKLTNLFDRLQGSAICQICDDPPEDAVISICGHVFCDQCVLDHLSGDDDTCPDKKCKKQLSTDIIFSKSAVSSCLSDESESSLSNGDQPSESSSLYLSDYTSSKVRAALEILQSLGKASVPCIDLDGPADDHALVSDPAINVRTEVINPCIDLDGSAEDGAPASHVGTEIVVHEPSGGRQKAIVFSQWTRMLDLMETALRRSGITYRRLDGKMSLNARDKAVREFNLDPEVDVMLMSLKAGNLGLNMIAACHVILLDLWWNPTTEDQAIDRAHRIGQTRAVTVSRLTVKETVEDRILALQDQKRKMVASAFGEENGGMSARMTPQDLRFLFMGA